MGGDGGGERLDAVPGAGAAHVGGGGVEPAERDLGRGADDGVGHGVILLRGSGKQPRCVPARRRDRGRRGGMRAGAAGPRRERGPEGHASEGSCRALGRVSGEPRGGAPLGAPSRAASTARVSRSPADDQISFVYRIGSIRHRLRYAVPDGAGCALAQILQWSLSGSVPPSDAGIRGRRLSRPRGTALASSLLPLARPIQRAEQTLGVAQGVSATAALHPGAALLRPSRADCGKAS